ncbi:CU044_2847 family protein [Streptomyces sp. NPDC057494]|uniref:CU044_2847 family protein n=1 Tax=Streptomyces sp. NPDC057494 TaxID=3346148 RepID=UPI0036B74239
MSNFTELQLADGTPLRFEVQAAPADGVPHEYPAPEDDLPDGMGESIPVGRGRRAAELAVGTLRGTLRPLGALLQEVHDAVVSSDDPPHEVNVTFGVQVAHDLKLGIVGANGQAHLTVSATWQPRPEPESDPRPES